MHGGKRSSRKWDVLQDIRHADKAEALDHCDIFDVVRIGFEPKISEFLDVLGAKIDTDRAVSPFCRSEEQ